MRRLISSLLLFLTALTLCDALTAQALQKRTPYAILPGDVLDIHYRYSPSFDQTVTVQPDGMVSLNVVGSMRAADLTVEQLHDLVVKKASERLNAPEITIVLKDFHHPYVVVGGEVAKPGKFDFHEGATALQAILLAGGYTENARSGQVLVFHRINDALAEVHVLKLGKLNTQPDLEHDMPLQPGDMIMVPRDRIAKISRYLKLANVGLYFNPLDRVW